jgi:hypothetical protein
MTERIISKAELSRWANVSRMAVTKAAAGPLADAVVGAKINAAHGLVREWLALHGCANLPPPPPPKVRKPRPSRAKSAAKPKPRPKAKPKKAPAALVAAVQVPEPETSAPGEMPRDIAGYPFEELEDLTIRELVMRHGSVDGFKRFVDSLKAIADYKYRELRTQQQRGLLIERERVAGAVFPLIDLAFSRLVSDVPASLAQLVVARVQSGGPEIVREVEQMIRDANSKVLKGTKVAINKTGIVNDEN